MYTEDGRYFCKPTGILQIVLHSQGCFYQRSGGGCKMCNYGTGHEMTMAGATGLVAQALTDFPEAERILIGANGSFLDEREVPLEITAEIFRLLSHSRAKNIYIETHAHTLSPKIFSYIKEKLPEKQVTFELGLESSNPKTLAELHKTLSLDYLERQIVLAHSYDFFIGLNVLYGTYFKNKVGMQADFIETCQWAEAAGADEIIAFLLHLKPETSYMKLYRQGKLIPPTHRDLIMALSGLDDKVLERLYFSWVGEHEEIVEKYGIVAPDYGGLNPDRVKDFYLEFVRTSRIDEKRRLINNILNAS